MMKRIIVVVLLNVLLITVDVHAAGNYEQCERWVINSGKALESVDNIPIVGKFTNLLPFAVASTCLQRCPGQTIVVLASLLLYSLLRSDSAYFSLRRSVTKNNKSVKDEEIRFDDTLFDFEDSIEDDNQKNKDDGLSGEQVPQNSDLL